VSTDLRALAAEVLDLCRDNRVLLATAESCTGGMISATLTDIAGSSDVFERGFVTYSNEAKQEMLGVQAATLAAVGAVSEEVAAEMALGALAHSRAGIAVSVTGIAGPGGSENKPEGRVCFGVAETGRPATTLTHDFGAIGRDAVRKATTERALRLIAAQITGKTLH
jgi:nicotinamide-nucleotide amidase